MVTINYLKMDKLELESELKSLEREYKKFIDMGLKLDMSRGKPGAEQLDLSSRILDIITSASDCKTSDKIDCRNYGVPYGISEIRDLFGEIMMVDPSNVVVGGNSSLNMMFDTISCFMTHSVNGYTPWIKQEEIKFLCPVPGYDRHFSITEYYGIQMINVPMTNDGPNMDIVEKLVSEDSSIKGIWCVPKYSNPQGVTYSDEVVKRFARLKPKACDFRIFWDNAYALHDISDTQDNLLSIMDECIKSGNEDLPIIFSSTSKITFPGSGVSALAASERNLSTLKKRYSVQTIGPDKINQLRHIRFFKDLNGIKNHMKKHKEILRPKFDAVLDKLNKEFSDNNIIKWTNPNGGYFISADVLEGCAKEVVRLCKDAGVILTNAGATFPYSIDPKDSNIRIAPTYPPVSELRLAMDLFCVCVKLAAVRKLLSGLE